MRSVREVLDRLRARGGSPAAEGSEEEIRRLEREFDLTWPEDYREYLRAVGGGPEAVTGLWPLSMISALNRTYRIPWTFPGLVGIGNDGFLVYAFDFRGSVPVISSLGLSSSLWDDVVVDADTFVEWLERRV